MKLYRIHTEHFENLPAITGRHFEGFTNIQAIGGWKGTLEKSAIIEVYSDSPEKVYQLADEIKSTNQQEAVLVASFEANIQLQ